MRFKIAMAAAYAGSVLASGVHAAPAGATSTTPSLNSGLSCNGTRMCVSNARLMICVNGEWRVDETRTAFTEDVCRQDNPRAPTFGK
jgi:hypothetical protein